MRRGLNRALYNQGLWPAAGLKGAGAASGFGLADVSGRVLSEVGLEEGALLGQRHVELGGHVDPHPQAFTGEAEHVTAHRAVVAPEMDVDFNNPHGSWAQTLAGEPRATAATIGTSTAIDRLIDMDESLARLGTTWARWPMGPG